MARVEVEVEATGDRMILLRFGAEDGQVLELELVPDGARRLCNLVGEAILAVSKIPEVLT